MKAGIFVRRFLIPAPPVSVACNDAPPAGGTVVLDRPDIGHGAICEPNRALSGRNSRDTVIIGSPAQVVFQPR
jgi:hypothetical protein